MFIKEVKLVSCVAGVLLLGRIKASASSGSAIAEGPRVEVDVGPASAETAVVEAVERE